MMLLKCDLLLMVGIAVIIGAESLYARQPENSDARSTQIFKQYPEADTDGDGKLSKKEAIAIKLKQFQRRFPEADANGDGTLTMQEAKAFQKQQRGEQINNRPQTRSPAPTHSDVKYGEHKLQAFDIWLTEPRTDGGTTPLCIFIHGGGFRGGDKAAVQKATINGMLNRGISFASMNYRLTNRGEFPYPTAMHDAARGLQLIRSHAKEWNIDPQRIACYGGSAGAGISLWLAFHDDLAKPQSDDLISRQSTRILAAGTMGGQSTYDMRTFRKWFGVADLPPHSAIADFYAMQAGETASTPRVAKLAEDASPINHLDKEDPPVFMLYTRPNSAVTKTTHEGIWVHHPLLGLKLQEAMHKLDLECLVSLPGQRVREYDDLFDFLATKLGE